MLEEYKRQSRASFAIQKMQRNNPGPAKRRTTRRLEERGDGVAVESEALLAAREEVARLSVAYDETAARAAELRWVGRVGGWGGCGLHACTGLPWPEWVG